MQFNQPDTQIPDLYNPLDLNRYSCIRYNPIRYSDPSGHRPDDGCRNEGSCNLTALQKGFDAQDAASNTYDPIGQKQKRNREIAEAIIYGGIETVASLLAEPIDWAYTAYHCANGDCSLWMVAGAALPLISGQTAKLLGTIELIPSNRYPLVTRRISAVSTELRNGQKVPWVYLDDLATDMAQGWKGDPLRVLDVNGKLVSLDNRRLTVAKMLGIDVPVTIQKATRAITQ